MDAHDIVDDLRTADDRAAGARTLAVLAVPVVAVAITCVALMIFEWAPPRVAPAPAHAASAAELGHPSRPQ